VRTAARRADARRAGQVQLGALYDAIMGGGGFLDAGEGAGEGTGAPGAPGAEAATALSFGVCVALGEGRASAHVLSGDGETLALRGSGGARLAVSQRILGLAVPARATLAQRAVLRKEVLAALPRAVDAVALVDVMTAAAVELVDGWCAACPPGPR
jgi:hypothetical protein